MSLEAGIIRDHRFIIIFLLLMVIPIESIYAQEKEGLLWFYESEFKYYNVEETWISSDGSFIMTYSHHNKDEVPDVYFFNGEGELWWSGVEKDVVRVSGDFKPTMAYIHVSKNGDYILIPTESTKEENANLYDKNGNLLWSYNFYPSTIYRTAISADGSYVLINTKDTVHLLDNGGNLLWSYPVSGAAHSMDIADDGSYIGIGDSDFFHLLNREGTLLWSKSGEPYVNDVKLSSDGSSVTISIGGNKIISYNIKNGEEEWTYQLSGYCEIISNDGSYIVIGRREVGVYVLDDSGTLIWKKDGNPACISVIPGENHILLGDYDTGPKLYNDEGKLLWNYPINKVMGCSISKNGYVVAGTRGKLSGTVGRLYYLKIPTGSVSISSNPSGADVFINEVNRGQTPFNTELIPDSYEISIKKPGFVEFSDSISIDSGDEEIIHKDLEPYGVISITSDPPNAKITIEETFEGNTPASIEARAGDYVINLYKSGYREHEETITIASGEHIELHRALELLGTISISSNPKDASVFMDGEWKGETPLEIEAEQGEKEILLKKIGYRAISEKINVKPGKTVYFHRDLKIKNEIKIIAALSLLSIIVLGKLKHGAKKKFERADAGKIIETHKSNPLFSIGFSLSEKCKKLKDEAESLISKSEEAYKVEKYKKSIELCNKARKPIVNAAKELIKMGDGAKDDKGKLTYYKTADIIYSSLGMVLPPQIKTIINEIEKSR